MKQYKHIFDALVNGEQLEEKMLNGWRCMNERDVLRYILDGFPVEYLRVKPKNININGHEVPEPVREPL